MSSRPQVSGRAHTRPHAPTAGGFEMQPAKHADIQLPPTDPFLHKYTPYSGNKITKQDVK
jgi:hypothetical protein